MIRDHFRVLVADLTTGRGTVVLEDGRDEVAGGSGLAARLFARYGRPEAPWDHPDQPLILAIGPLTGAFQPDGRLVDPAVSLDTTPRTAPLSVFNGMSGSGEWRLFVADVATGNSPSVQSWAVHLTGNAVPEPSAAALLALGAALLLRKRRA